MSRRAWIFIGVFVLSIVSAETLPAAKGVVILNKSGCDFFVAETSGGYALLEWYGGNDPYEGDTIVGDYEAYGFKDIYNTTRDAELKVWVEDYWLSKSSVLEKYHEKCE